MIKTIIIEDEAAATQVLKSLVAEFTPEIEIIGTASTVKDGVQIIKSLKPEIVFLDILLPDGNGFEVLDQCKNLDFEVVFTTAYTDFREQAFEHFALHYLTKPIDIEKLEKTIERYKKQQRTNYSKDKLESIKDSLLKKNNKIPLPIKDGYKIVDVSEIIRCEALSNYTKVYLINGQSITVAKTLKHFESLLDTANFFRLHKSHLVNTDFIKEIKTDGSVVLTNNESVVISQRSKKSFFNFLQKKP